MCLRCSCVCEMGIDLELLSSQTWSFIHHTTHSLSWSFIHHTTHSLGASFITPHIRCLGDTLSIICASNIHAGRSLSNCILCIQLICASKTSVHLTQSPGALAPFGYLHTHTDGLNDLQRDSLSTWRLASRRAARAHSATFALMRNFPLTPIQKFTGAHEFMKREAGYRY